MELFGLELMAELMATPLDTKKNILHHTLISLFILPPLAVTMLSKKQNK